MLLRLFSGSGFKEALIGILLSLPAILLCLMVHELSHGLMAYALGDDTAKRQGRLTLDPFSHLDPIGFLCMLIFGFGWARPVPVDISNFKNRKRGMALTALAGPLSNMVLAFVFFLAYIPLSYAYMSTHNIFLMVLSLFCNYTAILSIGLGVFNLIPVHPFDGSRIVDALLPYQMQVKFDTFFRKYQTIILLIIIFAVWNGALSWISSWFYGILFGLAQAVMHLFGL